MREDRTRPASVDQAASSNCIYLSSLEQSLLLFCTIRCSGPARWNNK